MTVSGAVNAAFTVDSLPYSRLRRASIVSVSFMHLGNADDLQVCGDLHNLCQQCTFNPLPTFQEIFEVRAGRFTS